MTGNLAFPDLRDPGPDSSDDHDTSTTRTGTLLKGSLASISVAIFAIAIFQQSAPLVIAAVIPLGFLATFVVVSPPPDPQILETSRTLNPSLAAPGRRVDVEVTVKNTTDELIRDIRVVDNVPESLAVTRGSPRGATALEPGESLLITYSVTARRGQFDFDSITIRIYSRFHSQQVTDECIPTGEDTLNCRLNVGPLPLHNRGAVSRGTLDADESGEGIEFHSLREYRQGDSLARIDWRHFAKNGDLRTINFHESGASVVILVLDARASANVVGTPGQPNAIELAAYAATQASRFLIKRDHAVGLALLGIEDQRTDQPFWIAPGHGSHHGQRISDVLAAATRTDPSEEEPQLSSRGDQDDIAGLIERAPRRGQMLWFTPMLDDEPLDWITHATGAGYPGRVFSPNVLTSEAVGASLESIDRHRRLLQCQQSECTVIDWHRETPLAEALEAMLQGGRP